MTAERDGKSRRTGQPDLLASLPAERPPASQPAPGIDPASIEKLLTEMRDLRNDFAELKEAVSAERLAPVTLDDLRAEVAGPREAESAERPAPVPAAVPQALTLEELEAWGNKFVTRVAEAARTADAPGDEAAATRIKGMEDAAEKAAAAAERIDGSLESTSDRVVAEIEGAVTTMNESLAKTRAQVIQQSRQADPILEVIKTRVAGPRYGWRTVFVCLIVFVAGMLLESYIHLLYRWL